MLERILPLSPITNAVHADAVLEIAYLMTAVDGRLGDDELAAYGEVIAAVRGKNPSNADVDALLDKFAGATEPDEIAERVRAIAPTMSTEIKQFAFKLAVALSLVDLDASRDEDDLVDVLAEALSIDDETRDSLTADVMTAFDAGSD